MRRPSKTIQGQSQCADGVCGVTARQARLVIELGVGVGGQAKTERGNLDACQFNFAFVLLKNSKKRLPFQIATDIIIAMDVLVYYSGGCGRKYERSAQHEVNKLLDQIFRKISPENRPRIK